MSTNKIRFHAAMRRRLVRKAEASAPPSPEALARHWEHCTNVLAAHAVEIQAAWLEVLALLEERGILVAGQPMPAAVERLERAQRALSQGPT